MRAWIASIILTSSLLHAEEKVIRLGTTRPIVSNGHFWTKPNNSQLIALSPDGRIVAALFEKNGVGKLCLRDAKSGKLIRNLKHAPHWPDWIEFSPNGKWLAGVGDDRCQVWEVASGKEHLRFQIKKLDCRVLAFSPDSRFLAFADDAKIQIRNLSEGMLLRTLKGHQRPVTALRFDHTGEKLFSASHPGDLTKYPFLEWQTPAMNDARFLTHSVKSGKIQKSITLPGTVLKSPRLISPDGQYLVSQEGFLDVGLYRLSKTISPVTLPSHFVQGIAFPPDGKSILFAHLSGKVGLRALPKMKLLRSLDRAHGLTAFSFSTDGKRMVGLARNDSDTFCLWNLENGKMLTQQSGHGESVTGLHWLADNRTILSSGQDGTTRFWDVKRQKQLSRVETGSLWNVQLSADRKLLIGVTRLGKVYARQMVDGKVKESFEGSAAGLGPDSISDLRFTPDARGVTFATPQTIRRWTPDKPSKALCGLPIGVAKISVRLPDQQTALVGNTGWPSRSGTFSNGELILWDLKKVDAIAKSPLEGWQPQHLKLSPDGEIFLLLVELPHSSSNTLEVGERVSFSRIFRTESQRRVKDAIFSQDSMLLFLVLQAQHHRSLTPDPTDVIEVWHIAAREKVTTVRGHRGCIQTMALSPDGRSLAVGGADGTITIHDISPIKWSPKKLRQWSKAELTQRWKLLANPQASLAYEAMGDLLHSPRQTLELIRRNCKPAPRLTDAEIAKIVARLNSSAFRKRQTAFETLIELGAQAEPVLRRTLKQKPTLELRRRIKLLLSKLNRFWLTPRQLQISRAIRVLKMLNTKEARKLRQEIAKGDPKAFQTREAKRGR